MLNLFFFEGNKPHLVLEMNFDSVVIASGSNDAGVWGQSSQPPGGHRGVEGGAPDAEAIFYIFFRKVRILRIFKHTLV